MLHIAGAQLWVHDQDEALEFWTQKVGLRVSQDVMIPELAFRWLTVSPPEQDDVAIILMAVPGPPMASPEVQEAIGDLMTKGFAGTVFLTTPDCRLAYKELSARGVEFNELPTERPYGIDAGFRDPSGNSVRLTQPFDMR